jgi:hypothetical protein
MALIAVELFERKNVMSLSAPGMNDILVPLEEPKVSEILTAT